jgi:hypothetical protein
MNYSKRFVVEPGAKVKLHKKRRVSERRLASEIARIISAEFSSADEQDRKWRFLQPLNCVGHKAQPEFACKEL